jgi:hypothetical protein
MVKVGQVYVNAMGERRKIVGELPGRFVVEFWTGNRHEYAACEIRSLVADRVWTLKEEA